MAAILARHPAVMRGASEGSLDEGPRTNYETKYLAEGRPIRDW